MTQCTWFMIACSFLPPLRPLRLAASEMPAESAETGSIFKIKIKINLSQSPRFMIWHVCCTNSRLKILISCDMEWFWCQGSYHCLVCLVCLVTLWPGLAKNYYFTLEKIVCFLSKATSGKRGQGLNLNMQLNMSNRVTVTWVTWVHERATD